MFRKKRFLGHDIEKRECSSCISLKSSSIKYRTRIYLTNSCQSETRQECLCSTCSVLLNSSSLIDSINENRFSIIHTIIACLISFLFGCLLMIYIIILCRYRRRHYRDYFQASTSNSSSSPHTAQDLNTFATLSNTNNQTNQFRSFDSSLSSTNGSVSAFLNDIPSRK
ncbi:unnamed protein product [Rotaria sp. Silwood2]|nr:unnamed protein product [Rotaria sp. Silwood2]CAF4302811.1 unnamed protein product [Rotaria sp. Silwood2]